MQRRLRALGVGLMFFLFTIGICGAKENLVFVKDRTDDILNEFQAKQPKEFDTATLQLNEKTSLVVHFYLTQSALDILNAGQFDVPDSAFSLSDYKKYFKDTVSDSIQYFLKITKPTNFTHVHWFIDDTGEDRKEGVSYAKINSRVIVSDARRWHKFYKGYRPFIGAMTSIHEFTHVNNYFFDSEETQLHREQTAVVFEILNLCRIQGEQKCLVTYPEKLLAEVKNPEDILSDDYHGMNVLRHVGFGLVKKVLGGTYSVRTDKVQALEQFAAQYLTNTSTGAEGFDNALSATSVLDATGGELTLQVLRETIHSELKANAFIDSGEEVERWEADER